MIFFPCYLEMLYLGEPIRSGSLVLQFVRFQGSSYFVRFRRGNNEQKGSLA